MPSSSLQNVGVMAALLLIVNSMTQCTAVAKLDVNKHYSLLAAIAVNSAVLLAVAFSAVLHDVFPMVRIGCKTVAQSVGSLPAASQLLMDNVPVELASGLVAGALGVACLSALVISIVIEMTLVYYCIVAVFFGYLWHCFGSFVYQLSVSP